MPGYQKQKKHSALHELNEAVALLVDLFKDQNGDVSLPLQNEEDCDVELDDGLGLQFGSGLVPFEFAEQEVVEPAETVGGSLGGAVGQVLADGEVGFVGVVVIGVAVKVAG